MNNKLKFQIFNQRLSAFTIAKEGNIGEIREFLKNVNFFEWCEYFIINNGEVQYYVNNEEDFKRLKKIFNL